MDTRQRTRCQRFIQPINDHDTTPPFCSGALQQFHTTSLISPPLPMFLWIRTIHPSPPFLLLSIHILLITPPPSLHCSDLSPKSASCLEETSSVPLEHLNVQPMF